MKRYQNILMLIAVVALVALPLWMVKKPAPGADGKDVEIFAGADNKAKDAISMVSPGYKPWFTPLMEPPSGEIGSLLFALQAALGAGFIGYWYGCARTRAKFDNALKTSAKC